MRGHPGWVKRHGPCMNTAIPTACSGRGPEGRRLSSVQEDYCLAMCVWCSIFLSIIRAPNWPARQPWASGVSATNHGQRVRDEGARGRRAHPIPYYFQSSQWAGLVWTPSTKMHAKDGGQEKRWHLSTKQQRMPPSSILESHTDPFLESWENHNVLSVCVCVCGDEVSWLNECGKEGLSPTNNWLTGSLSTLTHCKA